MRFLTILLALLASNAAAQHAQHYAGRQQREIKALSDEEAKQYLAGAGAGFARAAELNRFPGPMHVLELADPLKLSADQRAQTEALMKTHKAEARAIGAKVVAAERALDELFRAGRVEAPALAEAVRSAALAQAEFRLSHLETHRRMRSMLSDEQVAAYDRLRGYSGGGSHAPGGHKH